MRRAPVRTVAPLAAAVVLLGGCSLGGDWTGEHRAEEFCAELSSFADGGGAGFDQNLDDLAELAPDELRDDIETIQDTARVVQSGGIPGSFDAMLAASDRLLSYEEDNC